ncbi:MAG TPA: hypothetical protein PLF91_16485, partial [Mycolicibacterium fallax]|nr:hypothetical protein [Mycolicibacterium fallax]
DQSIEFIAEDELVEITPKGHAEHRESLAHRHTALVELLNNLTPEEIDALDRAIGPLQRLATGEPETTG